MSVLAGVHTFVAFDSKTSKAATGQRLAKVLYKTNRGGKAVVGAKRSACVSVPEIEDISQEQMDKLIPHIKTLLESAQDGICRDAYERNAISVSDMELSVDSCIFYIESDARGDRLTKEFIGMWFDENCAELLYVAFGEKLGVSDAPTESEVKRLESTVAVYREKFSSLAGGRTIFDSGTIQKLQKAIQICDCTDELAVRFQKRFVEMSKQQMDSLEAL